jgi:Cof subfamily protein (haloacid dehalogenase superfamily)
MAEFSGIKLLISDVDGTLVTHAKVLTDRARAAVQALRARGIRFAITSGRPPRGMAMFVEPLAIEEPIAGFNGGAYARPDLTILEAYTLVPDAASQALARIEADGLDAWVYTGDDWYVRNLNAPHVAREARTVQFEPSVTADFDNLLGQATKLVAVGDDFPLVRRADTELRSALGARASVSRSQDYYVDITHRLANKAEVVEYHARRLGLSPDAICTIGDGPNDVLMFGKSGASIAMGNALAEVQEQASAVTDSCDDEGFAKAVERYLL